MVNFLSLRFNNTISSRASGCIEAALRWGVARQGEGRGMEGAKGWGGELLEKFIIITNVLFISFFFRFTWSYFPDCVFAFIVSYFYSLVWWGILFLSLVSLLCLFCCFILVAERWKRMKTCCALMYLEWKNHSMYVFTHFHLRVWGVNWTNLTKVPIRFRLYFDWHFVKHLAEAKHKKGELILRLRLLTLRWLLIIGHIFTKTCHHLRDKMAWLKIHKLWYKSMGTHWSKQEKKRRKKIFHTKA